MLKHDKELTTKFNQAKKTKDKYGNITIDSTDFNKAMEARITDWGTAALSPQNKPKLADTPDAQPGELSK